MSLFKTLIYPLLLLLLSACGGDDDPATVTPPPPPMEDLPILSIDGVSKAEGTGGENMASFTINVSGTYEGTIEVDMATKDGSALAGMDYLPQPQTITIASPATSATVDIPLITDDLREGNEHFEVVLSNPTNATLGGTSTARAMILNDDAGTAAPEEGYTTPESYDLWKLKWADEFNGETVNTDNWTFQLGNGCDRDLCGWGNNELQQYSDQEKNVRIENGNLVIEAVKDGPTSFSSTRMITQDKQELRFGRIDIRAKLPTGQGIWPAIWMLGANIDEVGWPACGEIDIMELVGHEPHKVHGTVHYGPPSPNNKFTSSSRTAPKGDFSERFHVFSLVWHTNQLHWYVDDLLYFTITPSQLGNERYPFNDEFFFILNIAVGGNWPGRPDNTTVFPQRMEIDYIRVFERE